MIHWSTLRMAVRCGPFIFLAVLTLQGSAQEVEVDTLRATRPRGTPMEYTFPLIRVVGNDSASARINRSLFRKVLGVDASSKDPLSAMWQEEPGNPDPGVTTWMWKTVRSSAGVLTITFTIERCTMECEEITKHVLYDVRTGAMLDPNELFTDEGEAIMFPMIDQRWRTAVEDLRSSLGPDQEGGKVLKACLMDREMDRPMITDLMLEPDGLQFIVRPCSGNRGRMKKEPQWAVYMFHYELVDHLRPEVKEALDW